LKRIQINIVIIGAIFLSLLNLMAVSGYGMVLWDVEKELEVLFYNISLAIFTGGILYLMTSALPNYLETTKYRKIYKKSLFKFIDGSLKKLNSISEVDYSLNREELKTEFSKLSYGSRVSKGSPNKIYDILIQIYDLKESLYKECIPYISASGDFDVLMNLNKLTGHRIFSYRRRYLSEEYSNIEKDNVGIGAIIKSFHDELKSLKI